MMLLYIETIFENHFSRNTDVFDGYWWRWRRSARSNRAG